ncbi:RluA family pseudouridine synthase [Paenibacillus sacheonensis]|uniref:Pseudouridine synthase n=1 Tax=Paenibacillus sacheonensis TaxID=742054 RepID=A0A7X4YS40_9BACL|nr:RluA family pseudouridine synthase [Paenibacillus sacheonensis]MBM7566910.1 23S rRNA pseudouridine1911/1915/1917 synthase [Paenibacillus sacheonensis]NBC71532.1 RluA family pseudouridine synthase [Paenibacillus sacheonensis]
MEKKRPYKPAASGKPDASRGKSAPRGGPRAQAKSFGAGKPSPVKPAVTARPPAKSAIRSFEVKEAAELLAFLIAHVTGEGRNAIKSMLGRGQIAVDGTPVKLFNQPLKPGQTVTVSKERIAEKPPLIGLTILHEDADVIVVLKDAGLLSIASDQESELTAYRQLTAHVRASDPHNRIFVVHRLDRDTSGVMMFAKSEQVQQQLQTTWTDSVEERTYVALVEGKVKKPEGTIRSYLRESKTLKMYSSSNPTDALHAVTHYKVLQSSANFSLLEVALETGRKNQIRVHMEDIGHPIVGDKKYGSRSRAIGRLGLHARVLAFKHPTTGEHVRFETDIPKPFLNPFKEGFNAKK